MYNNFAYIYDNFMKNIPYEKWVLFIEKIFEENGLNPELVLDLACGSGTLTTIFAKKGYDMIGIDLSQDMLMVATEKAFAENLSILYLNQDMREFELYGTVDACFCLCDGLNYITCERDLLTVFKLVKNYLNPSGLFIFDVNTEFKFKNILGENVFAKSDEDSAYIWENFYDEDTKINEYSVDFFAKDEESGLYERFEEIHYQKAYSAQVISSLLEKAGFEILNIYDEEAFLDIHEKSEKIFFVARG
ncbi:MAG: class I SAM-dependent methyltransferase [Defluviitaleaceae bacterium]|nr:class I SAM-dependent methyltransferase [Defluviitaleaceae bacterium]